MRVRWRDHGKRIRVKHIRGEFYGTGIFAYFSDGWLAAGGKYLRRDWTRSEPTFRVPRDVVLHGEGPRYARFTADSHWLYRADWQPRVSCRIGR